mgnify:FL=1
MVRQFEETRRSTISLVLDLDSSAYESPEEFEMAVSVIGSLGVRALRDGRDARAVVSGEVPEFAKATVRTLRQLKVTTPRTLLDQLAGVESSTAVADLAVITRMLNETTSDTSLAFLVTGSQAPLSRIQAASYSFSVDVSVAAVVCDPEAEPSIRAMGRTRVLTLGVLGDLRQLLAKRARA